MKQKVLGKSLQQWISEYPLIRDLMRLEPLVWKNPHRRLTVQLPSLPIGWIDIKEADHLWKRFIPFFKKAFPETVSTDGRVESPLRNIASMKKSIQEYYKQPFEGSLYLKCDHELPIAGSIKARGGVFEVLRYAEKLAIDHGLVSKDDCYDLFLDPKFKQFFSQFTIGVGSTGNLALSIGTISAKLGFHVEVHMSADAKQWKKDLLRKKGVHVYEYKGDFSEAIKSGRERTQQNPRGYFVDDEDSRDLFLGYSVAALELKMQLKQKNIKVDEDHPLFVYLPCGVGGSPGGITFGLKHVFGDHVHCLFVEPTHSPSVLLGMMTGENEKVCVQDFGIDNRTEADGLAVGRPSRLATEISCYLVSCMYTVEDGDLYKLLALLADAENIFIESSAAPGLIGPIRLQESGYIQEDNLLAKMPEATHVAWSTGGSLVPKSDMEVVYQRGRLMLKRDG